MKKLLTTLSILLIATASYAQTYTVERVVKDDVLRLASGGTLTICVENDPREECQLLRSFSDEDIYRKSEDVSKLYTVERVIDGDECAEFGGEIVNTLSQADCGSKEYLGEVKGMRCPCICCKKKEEISDSDANLCDIPIASYVQLTPYDECVIELYKKRCNKGQGDDCIVRCLAKGGGKNIGGGCWHICFAYQEDSPHKSPPGMKNCKEKFWQPGE